MNLLHRAVLVGRRFITPPIRKLVIEHTTECNLSCSNCARNIGEIAIQRLGIRQICRLVEHTGARIISFEGLGESFCHSEIYSILYALRHHKTQVITNATMIDYDRLRPRKNLEIIISPYGKDQFRAAKRLSEMGITVKFNTVLFPDTKYLDNLVSIAEECGVKAINYSHPQGFLPGIKTMYDTGTWKEVRKRLVARAQKSNVRITIPPEVPTRQPCFYPWYMMRVHANGDVYPCSFLSQSPTGKYTETFAGLSMPIDQKELLAGNIFAESPWNIWRGEKMKKIRKSIMGWDDLFCGTSLSPKDLNILRKEFYPEYCAGCLHRWGVSC